MWTWTIVKYTRMHALPHCILSTCTWPAQFFLPVTFLFYHLETWAFTILFLTIGKSLYNPLCKLTNIYKILALTFSPYLLPLPLPFLYFIFSTAQLRSPHNLYYSTSFWNERIVAQCTRIIVWMSS